MGEKFLFSPQILEGQIQVGLEFLRKKAFLSSFFSADSTEVRLYRIFCFPPSTVPLKIYRRCQAENGIRSNSAFVSARVR